MLENGDDLVSRIHRDAIQAVPLPPPVTRPTIQYTQLTSTAKPDDRLYFEWDTYCWEIARRIAEGREGKWVLIKGETVVGFYEG